jgi:hypothetical protein
MKIDEFFRIPLISPSRSDVKKIQKPIKGKTEKLKTSAAGWDMEN